MKKLAIVAVLVLSSVVYAAPIEVTATVDNSIASDLITLCNRLRVARGYSSVGWTPTGANGCVQAVLNEGFAIITRELATVAANEQTQDTFNDTFTGIVDPIIAGLELNSPVRAICGDSNVDTEFGEACDDGTNALDGACPECSVSICGDGHVQAGVEDCDDANNFNNDGCSSICEVEP